MELLRLVSLVALIAAMSAAPLEEAIAPVAESLPVLEQEGGVPLPVQEATYPAPPPQEVTIPAVGPEINEVKIAPDAAGDVAATKAVLEELGGMGRTEYFGNPSISLNYADALKYCEDHGYQMVNMIPPANYRHLESQFRDKYKNDELSFWTQGMNSHNGNGNTLSYTSKFVGGQKQQDCGYVSMRDNNLMSREDRSCNTLRGVLCQKGDPHSELMKSMMMMNPLMSPMPFYQGFQMPNFGFFPGSGYFY